MHDNRFGYSAYGGGNSAGSSSNNSTHGNGNTGTNGNNNNNEAIVNKIHSTFASIRQDRDEMQRKAVMGKERLRLRQEEKDNLEKTVLDQQNQLSKLQAQVSGPAKAELEELKQKVQGLEMKAEFQHADLVSKQNKLASLQKQMKEDALEREQALRRGNDKLCKIRNRLASLLEGKKKNGTSSNTKGTKNSMTVATAKELLKLEMTGVNSDRLWKEWPRIVEQKATAVREETEDLKRSNEELTSILMGYRKHFRLLREENRPMAMGNGVAPMKH